MSNLAARAGRWSAAHWKTAVLGWVVFVTAAFSLTLFVQTRELTNVDMSSGDSKVAEEIIAGAGFAQHDSESVIIQHPTQRANDPAFKAVVRDVTSRLGGMRDVEELQSPCATCSVTTPATSWRNSAAPAATASWTPPSARTWPGPSSSRCRSPC
jgi:hypothetical protein